MSEFGSWERPGEPILKTLRDFSPEALSDLRAYFEAVDPLRVNAVNVIGQAEYLERLDTDSSVVSISSDPTEQTIYSYLVPARLLQTEGAIQVEIAATVKNNTAAVQTVRVKIKYGSTTLWNDVSDNMGISANLRGFGLRFLIGNAGATNAQKMAGMIGLGGAGAPTSGYGRFTFSFPAGNPDVIPFIPIGGTASEDSTVSKTLAVTVTLSASDANLIFEKVYAYTARIAH